MRGDKRSALTSRLVAPEASAGTKLGCRVTCHGSRVADHDRRWRMELWNGRRYNDCPDCPTIGARSNCMETVTRRWMGFFTGWEAEKYEQITTRLDCIALLHANYHKCRWAKETQGDAAVWRKCFYNNKLLKLIFYIYYVCGLTLTNLRARFGRSLWNGQRSGPNCWFWMRAAILSWWFGR